MVQVRDVRFNILINIALTLADDRVANVRLALCHLMDALREQLVDHSHRYDQQTQTQTQGQGQSHEPNFYTDYCDGPPTSTSAGTSTASGTGTGRRHTRSNSSLVLLALRRLLLDADRDVQHEAVQLRGHLEDDYAQYRVSRESREDRDGGG